MCSTVPDAFQQELRAVNIFKRVCISAADTAFCVYAVPAARFQIKDEKRYGSLKLRKHDVDLPVFQIAFSQLRTTGTLSGIDRELQNSFEAAFRTPIIFFQILKKWG